MFHAHNIDNSTPESFTKTILPWLSLKTGLAYHHHMPLPRIIGLEDGIPLPDLPSGAYCADINEILIDLSSGPQEIVEGVLTHELTHWLQEMNGVGLHNRSIADIERQAYNMERTFLQEIHNLNTDELGLTEEFIEYTIGQYPEFIRKLRNG